MRRTHAVVVVQRRARSNATVPRRAFARRWRAALYVAGADGCVKNLLMLLDDFWVWKMKAIQKEVEVSALPRSRCACPPARVE